MTTHEQIGDSATIYLGDALATLRTMQSDSVQCAVTSPPYFRLRDYGVPGQIGLENSPRAYIRKLVRVFEEVRRVLKPDGVMWLNLGDCYAQTGCGGIGDKSTLRGSSRSQNHARIPSVNRTRVVEGFKRKDLMGMPWRVALALQEKGWYLRCDVIWEKPSAMPESVTDRPNRVHEYLFLLTKSGKYKFNHEAIKEDAKPESAGRYQRAVGGEYKGLSVPRPQARVNTFHLARVNGEGYQVPEKRNRRSIWRVAAEPIPFEHFAPFPTGLVRPCILAGDEIGDVVLDPFMGSGTTGLVALELGCDFQGIELSEMFFQMAGERLRKAAIQPKLFRKAI